MEKYTAIVFLQGEIVSENENHQTIDWKNLENEGLFGYNIIVWTYGTMGAINS